MYFLFIFEQCVGQHFLNIILKQKPKETESTHPNVFQRFFFQKIRKRNWNNTYWEYTRVHEDKKVCPKVFCLKSTCLTVTSTGGFCILWGRVGGGRKRKKLFSHIRWLVATTGDETLFALSPSNTHAGCPSFSSREASQKLSFSSFPWLKPPPPNRPSSIH